MSDTLAATMISLNLAVGHAPDDVFNILLLPNPPQMNANQSALEWVYDSVKAGDRIIVYVPTGGMGNGAGSTFTQQDAAWVLDGSADVLGPWSSLEAMVTPSDVLLRSLDCDPGTLRTWRDAQARNEQLLGAGQRELTSTQHR